MAAVIGMQPRGFSGRKSSSGLMKSVMFVALARSLLVTSAFVCPWGTWKRAGQLFDGHSLTNRELRGVSPADCPVLKPHSNAATSNQYRKRARGWAAGAEEVEDFDVELDLDTKKLDILGTIITQVKQDGRVPASSHIVYDCTHGEWILAQMAYDRKIRLFSSRSSKELATIASVLPDDSRFMYTGALVPKQVKRVVKLPGLSAIVAKDVDSSLVTNEMIDQEKARLSAKGLSKVSQSRKRYLAEQGRSNRGDGPLGTLVKELGAFIYVDGGRSAADVIETALAINERCKNLSLVGLWAAGMDEETAFRLFEVVRQEAGMPSLRVVLEHKGPSSSLWFQALPGPKRGPIMWGFHYDL